MPKIILIMLVLLAALVVLGAVSTANRRRARVEHGKERADAEPTDSL
jgi:hypothetical protein